MLCSQDTRILHIGGCPEWVEKKHYGDILSSLHRKPHGKLTPSRPLWYATNQRVGSILSPSDSANLAMFSTRDVGVVRKCSLGDEKNIWGELVSFRGQLASVAFFNDIMPETTLQSLSAHGMIENL